MQDTYKPDGFNIIAYPCNEFEFKDLEPTTDKDIQLLFKELGCNFTVMDKTDVNGDETDAAI